MRYINGRFTYLLTYLQIYWSGDLPNIFSSTIFETPLFYFYFCQSALLSNPEGNTNVYIIKLSLRSDSTQQHAATVKE